MFCIICVQEIRIFWKKETKVKISQVGSTILTHVEMAQFRNKLNHTCLPQSFKFSNFLKIMQCFHFFKKIPAECDSLGNFFKTYKWVELSSIVIVLLNSITIIHFILDSGQHFGLSQGGSPLVVSLFTDIWKF